MIDFAGSASSVADGLRFADRGACVVRESVRAHFSVSMFLASEELYAPESDDDLRSGEWEQVTIEDYWDKSDDELYALLGSELLGDGLGLSPEDEEEKRRFGKQWFTNKHRELQRRICPHEQVRALSGSSGSDRLLDAYAILELVKQFTGDPTTAAVIAVLVARIGLGAFCRDVAVES
ncbi:hypothetical protein [Streptomyces sp. NPDC055506]